MKKEEKIAAESKGQRAKESVQSSEFKVQSSQSLLPLTSCPSGRRVVNGSEKTSLNPGLQPHSIWLKPVFDCNYSVRQLKQTAKESAVISNLSALSFAVDFSQRISEDVVRTGLQPKKANIECRMSINDGRIEEKENNEHRLTISSMRLAVRNRLALNKRISTVFHIKPSAIGIYFPAEGCISESRAVRACLMIRVFNN